MVCDYFFVGKGSPEIKFKFVAILNYWEQLKFTPVGSSVFAALLHLGKLKSITL